MDLQTFASHIKQIISAPVGDVFTLHAGCNTKARVKIVSDNIILINDCFVGDRSSTVDFYTRMITQSKGYKYGP